MRPDARPKTDSNAITDTQFSSGLGPWQRAQAGAITYRATNATMTLTLSKGTLNARITTAIKTSANPVLMPKSGLNLY